MLTCIHMVQVVANKSIRPSGERTYDKGNPTFVARLVIGQEDASGFIFPIIFDGSIIFPI